jgi:hypothetical protein
MFFFRQGYLEHSRVVRFRILSLWEGMQCENLFKVQDTEGTSGLLCWAEQSVSGQLLWKVWGVSWETHTIVVLGVKFPPWPHVCEYLVPNWSHCLGRLWNIEKAELHWGKWITGGKPWAFIPWSYFLFTLVHLTSVSSQPSLPATKPFLPVSEFSTP